MIAALSRAGSIVLLLADPAIVSGGVTAIATPGSGTLTMCRDWMIYDSCVVYDDVALPKRMAVGDTVLLSFGSDNRQYRFPVARVIKTGIDCTVLSDTTDNTTKINRLKVSSCLDVSGAN